MKTYEIEFRRVSYVTVTVEAENQDEAEANAWLGIDTSKESGGDWDVASTEEITHA